MKTSYQTKCSGICSIDKIPFWGTFTISYLFDEMEQVIDVNAIDNYLYGLASEEITVEELAKAAHFYFSKEFPVQKVKVQVEALSLNHSTITVEIGGV